jgi:hypothetical protein
MTCTTTHYAGCSCHEANHAKEIERLTNELNSYKKAKAENDERFVNERDEARAQLSEAIEVIRFYRDGSLARDFLKRIDGKPQSDGGS